MAIKKSEGNKKNNEIVYEVLEHCGSFGNENSKGYLWEVNYISWNEREPKYDIRRWDKKRNCTKGISLTGEELEELIDLLNSLRDE